MARGLSDLQRLILTMAYDNHVKENRQTPKYVLAIKLEGYSDFEVLDEIYNIPVEEFIDQLLDFKRYVDDVFIYNLKILKWRSLNRGLGDTHPAYHSIFYKYNMDDIDISDLPDPNEYDSISLKLEIFSNIISVIKANKRDELDNANQWLIQQGILTTVFPEATDNEMCDLFNYEIIWQKYIGHGLPIPRHEEGRRYKASEFRKKYVHFKHLDKAKYHTGKVSVAKAFKRLEERGLVFRVDSGINLMTEGKEFIGKLMVNT